MSKLTGLILFFALLLRAPAQTVESKDFPEAAQRAVLDATVRVLASSKDGGKEGTGVVVRRQGAFVYVLTAAHVVAKADKVVVETFTAKSYPKAAETFGGVEVLAQLPDRDFAVLRMAAGKEPPPVLALAPAGSAPRDGKFPVLTAGCDQGKAPTCVVDEVRAKKLVKKDKDVQVFFWECGKAPAAGRSGGPLVDAHGRLIGIGSGSQNGRGYYCHLDEIHAGLKGQGLGFIGSDKEDKKP